MICCGNRKENKSKDPYINRNLDPELVAILENIPPISWWPITLMMLGVILIWGTIGFLPWGFQYDSWPWMLSFGLDEDKAAQFGDSFGFVNSLISSLALVGVIAAIWLQKQELMEQRKEMMITQWELKKSTDAQKESADSQKTSADLQRQSKEELAKQARINLQSTILAALDGIAKAAENQQLYPGDEGPAAIAFVNEMRYVVIADILGNGDTEENSPFLLESLERWRKLSSQIAICNEIVFRATRLAQAGHHVSSSVHRPNPSDGDFPDDKRAEFETLLLEKCQQLTKLEAATVNDGVVTKLNDLATTLQQGTKEKLDRVIETANGHANTCRKSRSKLFASATQSRE